MKKLSLSLLLTACFLTAHSQSEWAEVGTRWWYHTTNYEDYNMTEEFEIIGQTTVDGKLCQVVEGPNGTSYTYEEGGKVYMWYTADSSFHLRYDWNKVAGDTFFCSVPGDTFICIVTNESIETYGGVAYDRQFIMVYDMDEPGSFAFDPVLKGLGGEVSFLTPIPTVFTVELWTYLVCYESAMTGLITVKDLVVVDCESLALPVDESVKAANKITIYPNPSSSQSTLQYQLPPTAQGEVRVFDSLGRQHSQFNITGGESSLALPAYPPGLYFVSLFVEGKVVAHGKFVQL